MVDVRGVMNMILKNSLNIYYTAGDTFRRTATPEISEEGSKLRFQIAKIEGGEPIINKTFPINSNGEYDIVLNDSETARLPVDSEYVYRLTQLNIDGEILTKTSGQFFIIWGSADVEDKIYIGATPEKKLLLKINDLTNELKTVKNDITYNNEELEEKIDKKANMTTHRGGFRGGNDTTALSGGAIGLGANTKDGGAVGQNATTLSGFAGGLNAKAAIINGETETAIDAIQLGTGTNTEEKSLQVYEFKLMNADGTVPEVRIPKLAEHDADIEALKASGGGSSVDLSNYYTKDEIDVLAVELADTVMSQTIDHSYSKGYINDYYYDSVQVDDKLSDKVDKESGRGLSSIKSFAILVNTADNERHDTSILVESQNGEIEENIFYNKTQIDAMYGDIDSALDEIIALQVAKGGDSV